MNGRLTCKFSKITVALSRIAGRAADMGRPADLQVLDPTHA
jgi:hypothetical protein